MCVAHDICTAHDMCAAHDMNAAHNMCAAHDMCATRVKRREAVARAFPLSGFTYFETVRNGGALGKYYIEIMNIHSLFSHQMPPSRMFS